MSTGLTVTQQQIEDLFAQSSAEEHIFWGRVLVIEYLLPSGFTVQGRAACVSPESFDLEIGRRIALEDAKKKTWPLEGYLLAHKLHQPTSN